MAAGERQTQKHRRKTPSFSSSLLDAIYHSIDDHHHPPLPHRRNPAAQIDDEIQSLRRAIMVEKWMQRHTPTTTAAAASRHLPTNSSSSTDSSCIFTSSETDSSATPKKPNRTGRFTRTKSRTGDLKKVKEPISPGGRIANFLNSIFSSKKDHHRHQPEWSSVRKSRSMKETAPSSSSTTSRSCLTTSSSRNVNNNNKSKRSVRFSPVLDGAGVGSRFIKKNMESIRVREDEEREYSDDKSCASSDLFELENIGAYDEELPVYGTTDFKINRAIAKGFIV